jgi:uncharacterized protein
MQFEGKITVNADQAAVWQLLLDVDEFASCVPGVENVHKIDDQTFDGTIAASVGPISGQFGFTARIVDSDPPHLMSAEIDGTDSVTKSIIHSDMKVTLTALSAHETELAYRAVVDVRGRLALIGDMVLMATAKLMLQEFTNRLQRKIEAGAAAG